MYTYFSNHGNAKQETGYDHKCPVYEGPLSRACKPRWVLISKRTQ